MANYLDFNDLRNEGITHLGNLTGKIWTDYNTHDPGITILETLCYALLDLDYRSQLPAADLFARNPAKPGADNNFFSPAQILACNPLTITDYRRLLSDIEGVRNAWLEVANDLADPCLPQNRPNFLNGLYRVYIEKEDTADQKEVLKSVQTQLSHHRNLCEDVVDIVFMGKQRLGVCAIVELNTDADVVTVYLDMISKLEDFLSPTPAFYTLQELLDKNKPIDAIFAGRPYDTSISHGFIDTDQLEKIQRRKEIHLSDLYKTLFEVTGIRTIRDLQWKSDTGTSNSWKFNILENNVVDFQPSLCGIQFLLNGKIVPFDATQYSAMLQVAMKKNLYKTLLPNLDLPYPQGAFHTDLADYYSIQNDFPAVYGIAKGGLPDNAPLPRIAWARQLKGFLLFFDQLLADYLMQLSHIRDLFSMGPSGGPTNFINPLDNPDRPDDPNYVPDVDLLWRSYVNNDLDHLLGGDGATLVYPASPDDLATPLSYTEWPDMQNTIVQLRAAFESNALKYTPLENSYYLTTPIPNLVLVCKKTFEPQPDDNKKQADAKKHADYVLNNGVLDSHYSSFSIGGGRFTFTLQYHQTTIANVLQSELEGPALQARRRQFFLDHLLSRFAEKFTDYALLQLNTGDPLQKAQNQIAAEENYLSNYAIISSERGKSGNYLSGKWNTDNVSGLERKWKALIGAGQEGRQSLCNFITHKSEPGYDLTIKMGEKVFFQPQEKYPSEEAARQDASAMLAAMSDWSNYSVTQSAPFSILIKYGEGTTIPLVGQYPTEIEASTVADRLFALFTQRPSQWDVFVSAYTTVQKDDFKIDINEKDNKFTYDLDKFISADAFDTKDEALAHAKELLVLATDPANYWVEDSTVWILSGGRRQAHYDTGLPAEEAAKQLEKIQEQFRQQPTNEPSRWKFHYYLGYEDQHRLCFDSTTDYESAAAALEALKQIGQNLPAFHIIQDGQNLTLSSGDTTLTPSSDDTTLTPPAAPAGDPSTAQSLLQIQQSIITASKATDPTPYTTIRIDDASQAGLISWQLARRDRPVAFCTTDFPDPATAETAKNRLVTLIQQGVRFLEICMDGRITRKRKDPQTGEPGYHYLIRSHNYFYASGKQLILFESVKGYPSEDAAKQAFTENYISLLEQASKETSYNTIISLAEVFSNNPDPNSPLVFVPKETKVSLGGADTDVIKKLVDIAGTFPLKRKESKNSFVYYCALTIPDPKGNPFEWLSTCSFSTIPDAQLDFALFIRLLKYSGNLFVDTYETADNKQTYRIYIHEVLAESTARFKEEKDAWGKDGVEKFICALRDENAILCYQRPEDCNNTFLVNCGPSALLHPVYYSTPAARDEALKTLIDLSGKWNPNAFISSRNGNALLLHDGQGAEFATAPIDDTTGDILLTIQLIENIHDSNNCYRIKDGFAQLVHIDGTTETLIAASTASGVDLQTWKQQLLLFADQYPFVQTADGRFAIELMLPDSADDASSIAWRSACTYTTSSDALTQITTLLKNSDYYLPTFTNDCRSFGIAFSDPKDKVAIHPQSYHAREQVIKAVARTKQAVNVEGLHIVEHILLRPQNASTDCTDASNARCSSPSECAFPWTSTDQDQPRDSNTPNYFVPGNDPWSFIATIVLPAWPDKFNTRENKIILENILYRESPAHIMLRVLWLNPKDCYEFETQYKHWLKTIAEQKKAGNDFFDGGFVKFIFTNTFNLPSPCDPCNPCPPAATTADDCTKNLSASRATRLPGFSDQVNDLYCWKQPSSTT